MFVPFLVLDVMMFYFLLCSGVSTRTELEGVLVTCDQDSHLQFTARNSATVWNFNIKSDKMMKGKMYVHIDVYLLILVLNFLAIIEH